jgi:type IV pilus assembly protein PilQ
MTTTTARKLLAHLPATARTIAGWIGVLASALLIAGNAYAVNELTDISIASMSDRQVVISFQMTSEPEDPSSFTIGNPSRIALDFADTLLKVESKEQDIRQSYAESISLAEAGGRTRAVITLTEMVPYQTRISGNNVELIIGSAGGQTTEVPATAVRQTASTSDYEEVGSVITDLDFRRGESGEGRLIITLSDESAPLDVRDEAGKVFVDFYETSVKPELLKRLDVTDFGTPIQLIDTLVQGSTARLVITPAGYYDQMAFQSGNVVTIELRPLTRMEQEELERDRFEFTGEKLSLNFQNIEVRAVLQLIADFTGLNVVVSDTVGGTITLRLQEVPWDQALDIILKSKGLSMRQSGNVIMVAPTQEIANREKLELESIRQVEDLSPLRSEFIQINYAKASSISALLGAGTENTMISGRGSVTVDERTNTILVRDTIENLAEVRRLVSRLDIPVRQVMIESRIVIASSNFYRDLGMRFTAGRNAGSGSRIASIGGTGSGSSESGEQSYGNTLGGKTEGGYAVDLPIPSPTATIGLSWGRIGSHLIGLELLAMQSEGSGEVVSNPRVVTSNQHKAMIEQGIDIPYQEQTGGTAGGTNVSFKRASLMLEVTPQITPDDSIIMDLVVKKDSIGEISASGEPSINTRSVETQVLVFNGETVVLGGVYEQDVIRNDGSVPYLSEIPLIGWMFRSKENKDLRQELLIFITPKILKEEIKISR